jgi:hypothetical protein
MNIPWSLDTEIKGASKGKVLIVIIKMSLVPYPASEEEDEQGKIRTVPHTPGQWPTLIFINGKTLIGLNLVPLTQDLDHLLQSCTNALKSIEPTIQPVEALHISLSRPLYLAFSQIDTLTFQLQQCLASISQYPFSC